nr:uncharacterized protein LOC124807228 [Hydra vulgaris]
MHHNHSIAILIFCNIGIILNGIGLFVLIKFTNGYNLTQRFILIQLSIVDLCLSVLVEIEECSNILNLNLSNSLVYSVIKEVFNAGFYFTTFWLVFDRYLHIKMNIKYVIYWPQKKSIIAAVILWSIAGLCGYVATYYSKTYYSCVVTSYDLVIICFSTFVYAYALIRFQKQKTNIRSNQHGKKILKGLIISSFIITIFFGLVAIPDTLWTLNNVGVYQNPKIDKYCKINYVIALWTDALVYIFASPQVRITLKNNIKFLLSKKKNQLQRFKEENTHF